MNHSARILALLLTAVLCASSLVACKPKSSDKTPSPSAPSEEANPYAALSPADLYTAMLEADNFMAVAHLQIDQALSESMIRKTISKNDGRVLTRTETYDGKQATRSTAYMDLKASRTYTQTDGEWISYAVDSGTLNPNQFLGELLGISNLLPYAQFFVNEHYDGYDEENERYYMSDSVLQRIFGENKSQITFAVNDTPGSYTICATVLQKPLRHTLTLEISFPGAEVILPNAKDVNAAFDYPSPSSLYARMLNEQELYLDIQSFNGLHYSLRRSQNVLWIDLHNDVGAFYYDLEKGTYFVRSRNTWYEKDDPKNHTLEEILTRLGVPADHYFLNESSYRTAETGITSLQLSEEALVANGLYLGTYTYDEQTGEYRFTAQRTEKPLICDQIKIRFDTEDTALPPTASNEYFHLTPGQLGAALGEADQLNVTVVGANQENYYTVGKDGDLVKFFDHAKQKTRYYDLAAHTVYTEEDGIWVSAPDNTTWKDILTQIGAGDVNFYDDRIYGELQFVPLYQQYDSVKRPAGMNYLYIRCDGTLYNIDANYRDGSDMGKYIAVVVEFTSTSVTLPRG